MKQFSKINRVVHIRVLIKKRIVSDESIVSKLIFAGLDAAGKTTIYKATMLEMPAKDLEKSKPTRGIDRHVSDFMDYDFSVWDLGGQKTYRETYLSRPEVFNSTKALIFIVDIQDTDRFEEAYAYYVDIMNILVNVDPIPKVYVFFHKFDPDKASRLRAHFFKATKLFRQADTITGTKFTGFATSIYSNSIQKAVKRVLWENLEGFQPSLEFKRPESQEQENKVPVISKGSTKKPGLSKSQIPKAPIVQPVQKAKDDPEEKPQLATSSIPKSSMPATQTSEGTQVSRDSSVLEPLESKSSQAAETKAIQSETKTPLKETFSEIKSPPEETTSQVTKEVSAEDEVISHKTSFEEGKTYEAIPNLSDLSTHIVDKLSNVINKRMHESPEILALAIVGTDGKVPLAVTKNELEKQKIDILQNVVKELNPKQFFSDIGDIEYRGLGHLTIGDFDIYFAKLSPEYAIAILANDVSTPMLENSQRIVKTIRQGLGMVENDEPVEDEPKTKDEKADLIGDLRNRLKRIGSLNSMNDK